MILAKVLGNIVASQKNARYDNARIMLCEQITPEGEASGPTLLALDSVEAGVGRHGADRAGRLGRLNLRQTGKPGAAIDSAIVGVVDHIEFLKAE